MMILVRSVLVPRADATALCPAVRCCFFFRALRSAPLTDLPFLTLTEHPVQRQQCPWSHHEPPGQQHEADVPGDLLRVLGLAGRNLATTTETTAVDREPASPGLGHRADEGEQHQPR